MVRSSAKVGVVVLLAIAFGIVLYSQLAHLKTSSYLVRVDVTDTQGLSAQSIVRMEGVAVGEVASVDLDKDNRPLVFLSIKKRYRIPADSALKITSGILITQAQVQIILVQHKRDARVAYLQTDGSAFLKAQPSPASMLDIIDPALGSTLGKLDKSFTVITDRFNDAYAKISVVLDQTKSLMSTANNIAGSANGVISDPSLKKNLIASLDNVRLTTEDAHKMTTDLRHDLDDLAAGSKGTFKDLGVKFSTILDSVDGIIEKTNTLVEKATEQVTDPHLQQTIAETADQLRNTIARFNQMASDIHQLTGDPTLQGDLKRTVANLADAAEHGKSVLEKADNLIDKVSGVTSHAPKIPKVKLVVNASQAINPGRFRADADAIVPFGKNQLFDLGLTDIGETNRMDVELGNYFGQGSDVRYGLIYGRLGVGLDYKTSSNTSLRADIYDPNLFHLDVRGLLRVNKNASIWGGVEDATRKPTPMIGIQFTN